MGPQIGGVIGIIFSFANVGMAALYIVGIAEFTSDLLQENGYKFTAFDPQNEIRLFALSRLNFYIILYQIIVKIITRLLHKNFFLSFY